MYDILSYQKARYVIIFDSQGFATLFIAGACVEWLTECVNVIQSRPTTHLGRLIISLSKLRVLPGIPRVYKRIWALESLRSCTIEEANPYRGEFFWRRNEKRVSSFEEGMRKRHKIIAPNVRGWIRRDEYSLQNNTFGYLKIKISSREGSLHY